MIQNAANELKDAAMRNRVNITAEALQLIAKHFAGLQGRKKLVWFTGSFPAAYSYTGQRNLRTQIEIREFGNEIEKAAHALNDANIAVYPIDPRGLIAGLAAPGIDTMNLFAGKTGGKAFYAINDMESAIQTIENDSEITYALGYYPADEKPGPGYHSISVKVARKGVDVRYRKGYFSSETSPLTEKQRKASIAEAFDNPLEATSLGLMARATPQPADKGIWNLDLGLNLNELHLEHEGEGDRERWVAQLSIATEFSAKKNPNGTLEDIKLTLTGARMREALQNGYVLRRPFAAGPLTGELRVVVQDRTTGDTGSVRLALGK
jgi:hypothetical protein